MDGVTEVADLQGHLWGKQYDCSALILWFCHLIDNNIFHVIVYVFLLWKQDTAKWKQVSLSSLVNSPKTIYSVVWEQMRKQLFRWHDINCLEKHFKLKCLCNRHTNLVWNFIHLVSLCKSRATSEVNLYTIKMPVFLEKKKLIARFMGPTWVHLRPTGPKWAQCWPHEPCHLENTVTNTFQVSLRCFAPVKLTIYNVAHFH